LYGFSDQVQFGCRNLPAGATCTFSSPTVTPSGSPASVTLTINTVKNTATAPPLWAPLRGAPPSAILWVLCTGVLLSLFHMRRHLGKRGAKISSPPWLWPKVVSLSFLLALAMLLGSCRSGTEGTPTGNYTITVTGTLSTNSDVVRTTPVNLAVT
jgi:hypothetical protein